jgi:hypothetical protein
MLPPLLTWENQAPPEFPPPRRTRREDDKTVLVNGCHGSLDAPNGAEEGGVPPQAAAGLGPSCARDHGHDSDYWRDSTSSSTSASMCEQDVD